ncbi:MAG: UDP-N-acetylglucosamine 1-carboxyvinyltransferase [Eubacteriales bacterium]|nr:UDP-N-acetylglucosamine 1-carboxyvinyltransferase [Eubacteriales bacterium]
MASYLIRGGRHLRGDVTVSGSKNAALGILAAAIICDGPCTIDNVPQVSDTMAMIDIISDIGAICKLEGNRLEIDPRGIQDARVVSERARDIRASYYLLGALLARLSSSDIFLPGGCNFGVRPIDLHLKGFEAMGASCNISHGRIRLDAKQLHGANIFLDKVSVGATINLMIAAAKAPGRTVIENAAREPHIVDVANFLNTMGARIRGAGTDMIRIDGVSSMPGRRSYSIIPDQIEAGTFMIAAAVTRGDVCVHNLIPKHMEPLSAKLKEMGAVVEEGGDFIRVYIPEGRHLSSTNFITMPYPGFPTDLQPQAVVLLCHAEGLSRMQENVWTSRFQYVEDLKLMGANIDVAERTCLITGPAQLTGSLVQARDLRAGAAMVLAGLSAQDETEIYDIFRLERGYENLVEKLTSIGANIRRSDISTLEVERNLK